MPELDQQDHPLVLLTGASGYVGGRLLPLMEQQPVTLRCLARSPDTVQPRVRESTQVVRGDVLDPSSLTAAMQGVHTAYYLIHHMSDLQVIPIPVSTITSLRSRGGKP